MSTQTPPIQLPITTAMSSRKGESSSKRGRGRPPTYVFSGEEELSESMEKLKLAIERRRKSQKDNYHRKKLEKKNKEKSKRVSSTTHQHRRSQPVENGGHILDMALSGVSHGSSSSYRK